MNPDTVPLDNGVVEPVACLRSMDTLMSVVPDVPVDSNSRLLPTRSEGLKRFRIAFLTGLPLLITDVVSASGIFLACGLLFGLNAGEFFQQLQITGLFCVTYVVVGRFLGLYPGTGTNAVSILRLQTHAVFFATVILFAAQGSTPWIQLADPACFLASAVVCSICLPMIRSIVRRKLVKFEWWGERAVVVGTTKNALAIFEFLQANAHLGLRPIGVVDEYPADYWVADTNKSIRFLGTTNNLLSICRSLNAHWVIATTGGQNKQELERVLTVCALIPNLIVANDNLPLPNLWSSSFDVAGVAGLRVKDRLLHPSVRAAKRMIDIVLSGMLLLLVSPLMIGVAACVKIASPGPVFFGHERIGRGGRKFEALKFRTMVQNADKVLDAYLTANSSARDEWNRNHKLLHDPRVISVVGHLLRSWSLDELPQLWNVFRGDMSLVGPRPIVTAEVEKYGHVFPLYVRVRPGLTGLWQVSGRNQTSYKARIKLDSYYVRNWSLWLDYYILLRTIKTVLTRQGSC